jgi:hypothetical protein
MSKVEMSERRAESSLCLFLQRVLGSVINLSSLPFKKKVKSEKRQLS